MCKFDVENFNYVEDRGSNDAPLVIEDDDDKFCCGNWQEKQNGGGKYRKLRTSYTCFPPTYFALKTLEICYQKCIKTPEICNKRR